MAKIYKVKYKYTVKETYLDGIGGSKQIDYDNYGEIKAQLSDEVSGSYERIKNLISKIENRNVVEICSVEKEITTPEEALEALERSREKALELLERVDAAISELKKNSIPTFECAVGRHYLIHEVDKKIRSLYDDVIFEEDGDVFCRKFFKKFDDVFEWEGCKQFEDCDFYFMVCDNYKNIKDSSVVSGSVLFDASEQAKKALKCIYESMI